MEHSFTLETGSRLSRVTAPAPAAPEYRIEVDQIEEEEWSQQMMCFLDASIYQTWAYGAVRWRESNLSHLVLRQNGRVAAMVQLRIVKVPGLGIAYARWGPLWRRQEHDADSGILRQMLEAMRAEYVLKRKLVLRVLPNEIKGQAGDIEGIYQAAGYKWCKASYRTILLHLSPPMETLKEQLTSRWRRQLNIAARKGLHIVAGEADRLFAVFERLHQEMVGRKKHLPGMNPAEFRRMQQRLPLCQKMRVLVCEHGGEPVAAIICSLIAKTGIYLLGATGDNGLDLRGSYLLHWKMMEELQALGAEYYDLNGYNPEVNPGTATFKEGFNGEETDFIGQYEACAGRTRWFLTRSAERGIEKIRKLSHYLARSKLRA